MGVKGCNMRNKERDCLYCGVNRKRIQNSSPKIKAKDLDLFMSYVKERYRIHVRKDVQLKHLPYTDNPILQKYRFTNIRREHDRETIWLIDNIVNNNFLTYRQKLLNIILFRLYNKHETMEIIGAPFHIEGLWSCKQAKENLKKCAEEHPNYVFFTNAFITGGLKRALKQKFPKEDFVPALVLRFIEYLNKSSLFEDVTACDTQKEVFKRLEDEYGIGGFLAYQIFVDFTYIPEFPFSENEFTVAGPGCKRGIDYLFKSKDGMTYEECLFWLRDNWKLFSDEKVYFDPEEEMVDLKLYDRVMNVMSLENCFCEFSKYYRAYHDLGRPRNNYKPRKGGN